MSQQKNMAAFASQRGLWLVRAYGGLTERNPWSMAFATCTGKGMLADAMSQSVIESKEEIDWHRNLVFGFYGGWYCGWFQHFLYNIVYTRMFGAETTVFIALC